MDRPAAGLRVLQNPASHNITMSVAHASLHQRLAAPRATYLGIPDSGINRISAGAAIPRGAEVQAVQFDEGDLLGHKMTVTLTGSEGIAWMGSLLGAPRPRPSKRANQAAKARQREAARRTGRGGKVSYRKRQESAKVARAQRGGIGGPFGA